MTDSSSPYTLSRTILTDTSPIRSVCYNPAANALLSGSEEGLIALSALDSSRVDIQTTQQHPHAVTAVTVLDNNGQYYATGCKDAKIRIYDTAAHQLVRTLEGHAHVVSSLDVLTVNGESRLVSGSWDGSFKIWNWTSGVCEATIGELENTVCVAALPPLDNGVGRLAVGTAGVSINNKISQHALRIYHIARDAAQGIAISIQNTIVEDHGGPIRGVCYNPNSNTLLTCSNDGTIKIRSLDGTCQSTLTIAASNVPLLLQVCTLDNGTICAAGEDGSLLIWRNGGQDDVQVIAHPACVWMTAALPGGNVVSACQDGHLRIFTLDSSQFAPQSERDAFLETVQAAQARTASGPRPEEISKYPKWELQSTMPGKSEGQVQVFQRGGKAIAAQWSMASQTWMEVGEVTGSRSGGTIGGVEYDYVFPIEIDTVQGTVQTLQIGYNTGDNPFVTAQAFIDEHMLDQGYLSQIADYIQQRVGDAGNVPTLGMDPSAQGTSTGTMPMEVTPTTPTYQYLPMRGYKAFETGADAKTLGKIGTKIREFYTHYGALEEPVTTQLDSLIATLSATNRYHATRITEKELDLVKEMVIAWNLEHIFPALDLVRLLVLHPDASQSNRVDYWKQIIEAVIEKCEQVPNTTVEGVAKVAIPMLSLRLFANCFRGRGSTLAASSYMER